MSKKIIMQIKTGKSDVQIYRAEDGAKITVSSANGTRELAGDEALEWWAEVNKSILKIFAAKPERHKYGVYKRVLLSDKEYERLIRDFGQKEAELCIACVDELAQEKNNKFKWHDWNLVVRKCHREQWHKSKAAEEAPRTSYDMGEFEERAAPLPVYKRKKETD